MRTADLMHRDVITVLPGNSVRHAAQLMLQHGISGLPVLDDNGLVVGMVTEGDLLRRIGSGASREVLSWHGATTPEGLARNFVKTHSWRVGDVMTTPAVTVAEDTPLHRVAELIATRNIKRLPVMHGDRMVGIISRADLMRWILVDAPAPIGQGDEAIRICVVARLRDALGIIGSMPDVTVQDRTVRLEGTIPSAAAREAVRVIVEGVPGVTGVDDKLIVRAA